MTDLDLSREHERAGRYAEAYDGVMVAVRDLTGGARAGHPDAGGDLADALMLASRLCLRLGRHDEAERHLERAAEVTRTGDPEIRLRVTVDRADLLRARGRYGDADVMLRNALVLAEESCGPDSLAVVRVCNSLGVLHKYTGRFDESERSYQRALKIVEALHGADHPYLADINHNLGGLNHARGTHALGEPFARRAVEIRRLVHGPAHPEVSGDQVALAAILRELGEEEAERLLREALAVFEEHFGPEHYEVASTLNNLAAFQYTRGDLEAAEATYRKVLTIKEELLGENHPELAVALNNLAATLRGSGRPKEAVTFLERALNLLDGVVERDQPVRLACLGNLDACRRLMSSPEAR
ncbi:tetratricopeptide repeat protein [Streptosporangium sp. NPDC006013]|uniref:tetratricopeptide repeat protein n=1 Tax=Streptosporangium sp. NPDC006013 TaxID=3155596 RepID=UPI0033A31863